MSKDVVEIRWIQDEEHTAAISLIASRSNVSARDLQDFMTHVNHLPHVLTVQGKVVGTNFHVLHRHVVMIRHFCVSDSAREAGYASRMIRELKKQMVTLRRRVLAIEVPETNLADQLLFKQCGFHCYRIIQRNGETRYVFRYEAPKRK